MYRARSFATLLGLAALTVHAPGCNGDKPTDTQAQVELEGDDPGECTDGADNDADGDFDCDDSDCAGAPDCTCDDADSDGVCDEDDPCPNDATDDSDGDGVCDGDDQCPGSDDAADRDTDGVADGCDDCPDDPDDDSDGDGSCDSVDLCTGDDATGDTDADGVCNDLDTCEGDDALDADADGVPDACDVCAGGDDLADADSDAVPDACDVCPFAADDDADGDGVCEDVDVCTGNDATGDGDSDGVCDDLDICPLGDDAIDTDSDGAPDACDLCPNDPTDLSCEPFQPDASDSLICAGTMEVPTIAASPAGFAVGCVPDASQNETGHVYFLDTAGSQINSFSSRTMEGYYFYPIRLSHHDGKYQAVYAYNCENGASTAVGWGCTCIDFHEFSDTGAVGDLLYHKQSCLNDHPVVDWTGSQFGMAWIGYDEQYFQVIDGNRTLSGATVHVNGDPQQADQRWSTRSHIAWDPVSQSFGILSNYPNRLYFTRVDAAGTVLTAQTQIGTAYSGAFAGEMEIVALNGSFFVAYYDPSGGGTKLAKISTAGTVVDVVSVPTASTNYAFVTTKGSQLYVFGHDASVRAEVYVYDDALVMDTRKSGLVGGAAASFSMEHPVAAWNPTLQMWGLAGKGTGGIVFRRAAEAP